MSVESEFKKEMVEIKARLEKLEEMFPRLYQTMIGVKMIGETNIERGNEIIKLMDELIKNLTNIIKS
jgi:hypothetical protein